MSMSIAYGPFDDPTAVSLLSPSGSINEMLQKWGEDPSEYYVFDLPMGASRWGTYSVVAQTTQVAAILALCGTAGNNLAINSDVLDDLQIQVAVVTAISQIDPQGYFTRIDFADRRFLLQWSIVSMNINMAKDSLQSSDFIASGQFLPAIISTLTTALGISASLPSGYTGEQPDNLVLKSVPAAKALDRLLNTYGLILQYDPIVDEFTIDSIGHGKSSLDAFAIDQNNQPLRTDNANIPPNADSPASVSVVNEQIIVTDDNVASGIVTSSTSGLPVNSTPGGVVGVPGPVYAFGPSGGDIVGDPDLIGSGFFNRITTLRKQPFFGLLQPPMVGALERVVWHTTQDHHTTILYYAPRPYRAWDNFDQSSHLGIFSRIDPFGRGQYRMTPWRAIVVGVTSDFDEGTYFGRYKGKSYLPGTATATSPGTQSSEEDVIIINGAEWGLAAANYLLASPNTTTFAVDPVPGVVNGIDPDTGLRVVIINLPYGNC